MSVTRDWKFYLIIAVVALLAAIFVVSCGNKEKTLVGLMGPKPASPSTHAAKPVAAFQFRETQAPKIEIEPLNGRYSLGAVIDLRWSFTGLAEDMKIRVELMS